MTLLDDVRSAVRGLSTNKLRSALTVLGIFIGVGAVIIVVAYGNGSSQAVQNRIKALGTNTITVLNRGRFGRGPATAGTQSRSATITSQDVAAMEDPNQAPDILTVSPVLSSSQTASYSGASDTSVSITGTTPTYLQAEDYVVQGGSPLTDAQVSNHAQVVLIGQTVVSDLFQPGQNPIGTNVYFGTARFQVVGVLASKTSATSLIDPNNVAIIPYTTAQDLLTGYTDNFGELIVQARSAKAVDAAEQETADILASANRTSVANLPFTVLNEQQLLSTSASTSSTFTVLLTVIAAVSLLVGGIGIMNIMLVVVTERTREIGIRKAIGAPRRAILGQFLTEAVLLSLIGGLVGVVVGLIGTSFKINGVKPVPTAGSVIGAFAVAVAVGVFFGFYPASRAAALRPVDALRYE
ncbi:MAG TPA: ABC transporter permease [Acidimicrobiales bacterium]|nr:ABC transporter permease [Acidimicrobiales bacterium]